MKKLLSILTACAIALSFVTAAKNKDSIIVYSCMEQFRNDELQKQLHEQFPDLDVFVLYIPTAKAAAKISIEGTNTDADIVVALDKAYMKKIEKYMADVSKYSKLEYLDDMKVTNGRYLTWERASGSIIVNRKVLKKYRLPLPETYEDLVKPAYKNLVAMPDPKSSGTGFTFFRSMVNGMGEEGAFEYIDRLQQNIKQFTESGAGPIKMLKEGEIAVGLALTLQGVNELNNGNDFLLIEPEFGYPYYLTCASIIEGRQNNENIEKVFEFIVNDYMLYDRMYGSPEQVLKNQVNKVKNYPVNLRYADMTGIDDIEEKERLLAKWKY